MVRRAYVPAYKAAIKYNTHNSRDSNQILLTDEDQQVFHVLHTEGEVCYLRLPCYRPRSRGDNTFCSVRVCVRPFVCGRSPV